MIFQTQHDANTWSHVLSKILATEANIKTSPSSLFILYTIINTEESFPWQVSLVCEPKGPFWFSYENVSQ